MSMDLFKRVIDDYISITDVKEVGLTPTIGDSFIDPHFPEKIKYLYSKRIKCGLYTNAILLSKYWEKILKSGLNSINIDLADIIPKYDAKVFRISEEMSKHRIDSTIKFLQMVEEAKIDLVVRIDFRPMRKPREIIKDMKNTPLWEYYQSGKIEFGFLQSYDNWGGLIKGSDLLGNQTLKRPPKIKKYPCKGLFTVSILPSGDYRLCGCRCMGTYKDELVIGNEKNIKFNDLKNSSKWKKVLKDFTSGNIPKVCQKCSFYRPHITK